MTGEVLSSFVHPGTVQIACSSLKSKRIKAYLDEACCEGGGDPPCLLSNAFTLKEITVIGQAGTESDRSKKKNKESVYYRRANKAYELGRFKQAAALFNKAKIETDLDIKGLYRLSSAYRREDRCSRAIGPLREIEQRVRKRDYWATEENYIREAHFLLARCYSKLNKAGYAVTILQSYLLEPRKYRRELLQSLSHKDFGWIKTTKEYIKYRREAERKLNTK